MRIDLTTLHPSIREEIGRFRGQLSYSTNLGINLKPEVQEAFATQQRLFWKRAAGPGIALISGVVAAILLLIFLVNTTWSMHGMAPGLIILGTIPASLALIFLAYRTASKSLTNEELQALAPGMTLDETQRVYLSAFILAHSGQFSNELANDMTRQMNDLLDDHARLISKRDQLLSFGSTQPGKEHKQEIERLESLVASTQDEDARSIYGESLEMAKERAQRRVSATALAERIDAQLELVKQTMVTLTDGVVSLAGTPAFDDDRLDGLRDRISSVRHQTTAIDEAIREMGILS